MKIVMNLVLASLFTVPAFASEAHKSAAEKNRTDIKKIAFDLKDQKAKNENNEKSDRYRINDKDQKFQGSAFESIKDLKVRPTAFTDRRAIMTPEEKRREDEGAYGDHFENGKYSTFTGSEHRPTNYGAKVTLPIGKGAAQ